MVKKLPEDKRVLFSLAARLDLYISLCIYKLIKIADSEFAASTKSSDELAIARRNGSVFEVARHKELVRYSEREIRRQ